MKAAHLILYVADQRRSASFYRAALADEPVVDVPGMTEFALTDGCRLGLMPSAGIVRLLGDGIPDPELAHGVPRAELYLLVEDSEVGLARALAAGAVELSASAPRDWGHRVG